MSELKPCPFCGGEAYTYTCSTMRKGKVAKLWIVHCKGCGLNYPPNIRGYRGEYEFEAIVAWNKRTESEELAFTRKFVHEHGLEFALAEAWNRRAEDVKL